MSLFESEQPSPVPTQPLFDSEIASPVPENLRWTRVKIPPGCTHKGWLAGKTVVVTCHWTNDKSQPCYNLITKGKLDCPYCEIPKPLKKRKIGYTPLIGKTGKKEVVIVSEMMCPLINNIVIGQEVEFTRTVGPRDPLRIKLTGFVEAGQAPRKLIFGSDDRPMRHGHDITPWLLTFWGDRELQTFFDRLQPTYSVAEAALKLQLERKGKIEQNADSPTLSAVVSSPQSADVPTIKAHLKRFLDDGNTRADAKSQDGAATSSSQGEGDGDNNTGRSRPASNGKHRRIKKE